jgi:hypothetical protein
VRLSWHRPKGAGERGLELIIQSRELLCQGTSCC